MYVEYLLVDIHKAYMYIRSLLIEAAVLEIIFNY